MTRINGGKTQTRHLAQGQLIGKIIEECNEHGYSLFEIAQTLLQMDIGDNGFSITINHPGHRGLA